jgi:hypothetical protein
VRIHPCQGELQVRHPPVSSLPEEGPPGGRAGRHIGCGLLDRTEVALVPFDVMRANEQYVWTLLL